MDDFLMKFFPSVYQRKLHAREDNYCKFNNQYLQLFTSSLYLSALVFSFAASKVCDKFGRKPTIFSASIFFLFGAALSSGATNLAMLIIGRILLGVGVGFGNEVLRCVLYIFESVSLVLYNIITILMQLLLFNLS